MSYTYVYIARVPTDVEGRNLRIVAAFYDEDDAKIVKDDWGHQAYVEKIKLYNCISQYSVDRNSELRNKALAKLTNEEKIALGLVSGS